MEAPDPSPLETWTPRPRPLKKRLAIRASQMAAEAHEVWLLGRDDSYRNLASTYRLPDGSRRVYCHHVRKTAGTSLWSSFMALGGEDPEVVQRRLNLDRLKRTVSGPYAYASTLRRVLAEGAYFYGRAHRPAEEQPLPPGTFTVTVLRDPLARVHSYYDYLVAGDAEDAPGRVAMKERVLAAGGFDAFLGRVSDRDLLTQLWTFSTRFDITEAVDRIGECSHVMFTEDFAAGLATLARRLDLPLQPYRARTTSRRSTLTDAQRDELRHRLEPEYRLLEALAAAGVAPGTN